MRTIHLILLSSILLLITSCSDPKKKPKPFKQKTAAEIEASIVADKDGVGPINGLELPNTINSDLVAKGKSIFDSKCIACHKTTERHLGPPIKGVLDKRTPSWVMNMIINPERMIKHDPVAKKLLAEYKGVPMLNQNIKEDEARAIVEYMRTIK